MDKNSKSFIASVTDSFRPHLRVAAAKKCSLHSCIMHVALWLEPPQVLKVRL